MQKNRDNGLSIIMRYLFLTLWLLMPCSCFGSSLLTIGNADPVPTAKESIAVSAGTLVVDFHKYAVPLLKGTLNKQSYHYSDYFFQISHAESGLTVERFDFSRGTYEPTNVCDFPIQLIGGKVKFSKDRSILVALQDYENGCYKWHFPASTDDSLFVANLEYERLIEKLRQKLRDENRHYADRALSFTDIKIDEDGHIKELWFGFPENDLLKGHVIEEGANISINWENTFLHEDKFHPSLQLFSVDVEGDSVPYYYVPPAGDSNGKTVVMVEGGPAVQYEGKYSTYIKAFTEAGWSVIIPQESLRRGYGWKYFSKGFGELGRKNLYQLLHVFHDAIDKNFINPEQTHLYGRSYGGLVATSFALRWNELHAEAGLEIRFNFQSIIADAALVDIGSEMRLKSDMIILGDMPREDFRKTFMPLHKIGSTLSAPLTLVHGRTDRKCPASYIAEFSRKLQSKSLSHKLFWHKGGHGSGYGIEHLLYPDFLLALAQGDSTDELATSIGFIRGV